MKHYIGRPDSLVGRSEAEVETYDFLDKLDVDYETLFTMPLLRWMSVRKWSTNWACPFLRICFSVTDNRHNSIC